MVAVPHREADRFIASKQDGVTVYLVFGTDPGLISERVSNLIALARRPAPDLEVIRIEGDELAANPGLLYEEAHSLGLFSNARLILVRIGSRQITRAIETALENPVTDCKIVIQGGALRRDAPLRVLITRARSGAAIECYPDQAHDLERLIDAELCAANLEIEPGARALLAGLLGDDRLTTRAELEKLVLYAKGANRITETDVIQAVADASAYIQDNLVSAVFSGRLALLGDQGFQKYSGSSEVNAFLAATIRHAVLLSTIRNEVDSGAGVQAAVEKHAGRSVFGPRRESLVAQASAWNRETVVKCLVMLNQAILDVRREPALSPAIAMQAMIDIARLQRASLASRNHPN